MAPKNWVSVAIQLPPPFLLPRAHLLNPVSRNVVVSQPHAQPRRSFGIKSMDPPRHSHYNTGGHGLPALLSSPQAAHERRVQANTIPLRTGALAIKKGMTSMFDTTTGVRTPCTVLQLDRVQVVAHKTRRRNGYFAVCVGSGLKRAQNVTKPMLGHFSKQGVAPKRHLQEFRVLDRDGLLPIGQEITADWFLEGQFVDARSNTKGKGFQGVMKRWGMHGQDRSHGVSLTHRSLGSAGQGQGGGSRVYPGKKMAGNMGGERNTVQNLRVMQVDSEKGIIVLNGKLNSMNAALFNALSY